MNIVGKAHLLASLVALATGAWVLWRPKGSRSHRRVGWVYAGSMLALNVTALHLYRLTGMFGPFHVAALISLATVAAGLIAATGRRADDRWIERHYYFMAYSYLGLVAAAISEIATRVPAIHSVVGGPNPLFWITVVIATIVVIGIGARIIHVRFESTVRSVRHITHPPADR